MSSNKCLTFLFILSNAITSYGMETMPEDKMPIEFDKQQVISNAQETKLLFNKGVYYILEQDCARRLSKKDIQPPESFRQHKEYKNENMQEMKKHYKYHLLKKQDGSYVLLIEDTLKGGGVIGASAGAIGGKFIGEAVCHGVLLGVAALSGPASGPVYAGLLGVFAAPIEAATNSFAVGCGILLGTVTGPI